ncbi:NmrA family transcriptional regulator [Streptomyces spinoverrucosus]|uniref:NmrA family transcriptional regulator n=1 Tax=Streptomyces spinoverrucosus TaxID=284043 RepID=A0A4Y3VNB0_9ACTN|nr:NAD(P)H-binding protein [Streptomyces spinoverrucosus]GEC06526.1 NmrA family transcriptional regulator [Streptomyces spinoverrucosus]GHB54559.1 NmrA family transcriptional regulator [Streptomyces spinoverrucosus]
MILVTGATGNIGSALVKELRAFGVGPVRGLTRDIARAVFPAAVEAVEGDMARPASLKAALEGVRSLFLVSRLGPDAEILEAARRAGVEHVVLVSSITVQSHPHLGPAKENLAVERLLKGSGMTWTILRPTQFASNALWWAEAIRERQSVRVPYADIGLPTIHPADIASVARAALTEPGHGGLTYAMTGPEQITPRQQLAAIAQAVGREVPFVEISRAEAHRDMAAFLGDEAAAAVLDITGGDVNEELLSVRNTVTQVTRAPARTFAQWAGENADSFR